MIQVAFTNNYGEVVQIISPGSDGAYGDGEVVGDFTARHISSEEDPRHFMQYKYWNDGWQTRESRPGAFYVWEGSWVFESNSFLSAVRSDRNAKLYRSDWTVLPDAPITEAEQAAWLNYRQALRDFPSTITTETTLEELAWPTAP